MTRDVLNDGETGLVIRGKINDNFVEVFPRSKSDLDDLLTTGSAQNLIISLDPSIDYSSMGQLNIANADNITIYGNGATVDAYFNFGSSYARTVNLYDINFSSTQDNPFLKFATDVDDINVVNCTFTNTSATYSGVEATLIYANMGTDTLVGMNIENCKFYFTGNSSFKVGVKFDNSGSTTFSNIMIKGCYFKVTGGFIIESDAMVDSIISNCISDTSDAISIVTNSDNVLIENCVFKNCIWGVELGGDNCTVRGCRFSGTSSTWNIVITGPLSDCVIDSNIFVEDSIGLSGSATGAENVYITNNKFLEGANIAIDKAMTDLNIISNYFDGNGSTVIFLNATQLVTGCNIHNNTVDTTRCSGTEYTFRFISSQDRNELSVFGNTVLGIYGLVDEKNIDVETNKINHVVLGKDDIYQNKTYHTISTTDKGVDIKIEENTNGGAPQGFIKMYVTMYNANNTAKFGEYRIHTGTFSSKTEDPGVTYIDNSYFGNLTVDSVADGSNIDLYIDFSTPANITSSARLMFEFYGFGAPYTLVSLASRAE